MRCRTGNPVKRALEAGEPSFGSWIQMGHPAIAEILAQAGFDWIAMDMEHTDIGIEGFTALARAIGESGPLPMARVRENNTLAIRQVLDAGAWGVIVPLVNSAAEAEAAVRAAKFPPRGIRGTAFFRANDYGSAFADYMAKANDEILVIVMIETKEAVAAIDEILAVEGVDGVFIGPYDLSLSLGIPGQLGDPRMTEARQAVVEGCRRAGKAAGIHQVLLGEESVAGVLKEGFRFVGLGMDTVFLDAAARQARAQSRAAADKVRMLRQGGGL